MICDRAFRSMRSELAVLCGWNKPANEAIKPWKKQETNEISEQRGATIT